MTVIGSFIEQYTKKLDFYREAARICAQICETNMEQMGIRTIVTSRAKKPDRLRDKLEKRGFQKNYGSLEEIGEDIADLAGVRIALYFPGDLYKVQQFIEANFRIKECRSFPEDMPSQEGQDMRPPGAVRPLGAREYRKRFSGYWAIHYRVYMQEQALPEEAKRYADTMIEIQVASALMHAWAEVEHDLVYKPYSGELSYEEYQILDELNGLVLAGEIALQRLQKAVKNRVSQVGKEFNNHYELAMFLYNKLGYTSEDSQREIVLGRVDLLYHCIKASDYNKPENLKELLGQVDPELKSRPVVDQILDRISEIDPELYVRYRNIKQNEELKYQMDTLHMNRENGNRQGEANTLANIGYLYVSRENYEEAVNYFMKAVEINHEIGGLQGEANQLTNVGSAYRQTGDPEKALEYCNRAIALHRQINYKQGQANTLGTMGNIYSDKGDYEKARGYYNEALEIYRETNYKTGEVMQLNNLGVLYLKERDLEQALFYFNLALKVCMECDYRIGEGDALHNIGEIHLERGEVTEAIAYLEKALSVQEASGNQKNKAGILISLGKAHAKRGDISEAVRLWKEALVLSSHIEFRNGAEEAQENINRVQGGLGLG